MAVVLDTLKQQITETLNLDADAWDGVGADDPLFMAGLGLDSIDALELVVMVERDYGIKIKDMNDGQNAFASLSALGAYIESQQAD